MFRMVLYLLLYRRKAKHQCYILTAEASNPEVSGFVIQQWVGKTFGLVLNIGNVHSTTAVEQDGTMENASY